MNHTRILVIDDDPSASLLLAAVLRQKGFEPVHAASGAEALAVLEREAVSAVCLDLVLPDQTGESVLRQIQGRWPGLPVIVLSGQDSVSRAVEIMKLGVFDYFVKPFEHERLARSLTLAIRDRDLERRVKQLEQEVQDTLRFDEIVGRSPRMRLVYDQVEKVLENAVSVFIQGESGTGKELIARAIHYHGARRAGPFVTLNCGAIAESLQESELFGHEKGAFTGAVAQYRGKFEQAHRGTLFLDEIGELHASAQTRLLRVLQEGTIQRLGGTGSVPVDVRIVSATHRNLEELVEQKAFRHDLYYRLVVFPIELPPLRLRTEDVPALVHHLLRKHKGLAPKGEATFDQDAIDVLCRYDYPGNVRELENIVLRALVSSGGGKIGVDALPPALVMRSMGVTPDDEQDAVAAPGRVESLDDIERRAIEQAIAALDGNMSLVAKRLGVGRATLPPTGPIRASANEPALGCLVAALPSVGVRPVARLDRAELARHGHQLRVELHEGVLDGRVGRVARVALGAPWQRRLRGLLPAEVEKAPPARQARVLDVAFDGHQVRLVEPGLVDGPLAGRLADLEHEHRAVGPLA